MNTNRISGFSDKNVEVSMFFSEKFTVTKIKEY